MKKYLSKLCRLAPVILIIFAALIMISKTALSQESTTIRPIEDFIDTQGTYCIGEPPDCFLIVPPIANFLGWGDPASGLNASVDYAGLADEYLNGLIGTEFDGTVIERPLADGRAQVRVILHTSNALAWVIEGEDFAGDPLIFGCRAPDVALGQTPGLADSHMNLVFINSAPGAPLPDLIQILIEENLIFLSFKATATGPLREEFDVEDGTPGMVKVTQTGLFMKPYMGAVEVRFPVERIKVHKVGK